MAFCPNCAAEMAPADPICPRCRYNFPVDDGSIRRPGFAYSKVAQAALVAGSVVAGFGVVGMLIASMVAILQGNLVEGLVRGPLAAVFLLACLIAFLRVQD